MNVAKLNNSNLFLNMKKYILAFALVIMAGIFIGIASGNDGIWAGCSKNIVDCNATKSGVECDGGVIKVLNEYSSLQTAPDGDKYNNTVVRYGCTNCGGSGQKTNYYNDNTLVYQSGSYTAGSGKVEGSHSWTKSTTISAATCTSYRTYRLVCAYCGQIGDTLRTDTDGGYNSSNHSSSTIVYGGTASCHRKYKCCNAVYEGSAYHSYTSATTTAATCTTTGVKTYTCSCGYSYTETIPKAGHSWSWTSNATQHYQVCGVCSATQSAENHEWPSSFSSGGTGIQYKNCSDTNCNRRLQTQYLITLAKGTGVDSVSGGGWVNSGSSTTMTANMKTGYSFVNWSYTSNGTTTTKYITGQTNARFPESPYTVLAPYTVTANGTANKYTVSFNPGSHDCSNCDGVDASSCSEITVTYDSTYGTLPTPTLEGHTFTGWKDADKNTITKDTIVKTANNHTLYGNWSINNYNVVYNANGGTVNGSSTYTKATTYHDNIDLSIEAVKDDMVFVGWAYDSDAHYVLGSEPIMPANTVTLYAIYSYPVSDVKQVELECYSKMDNKFNEFLLNNDGGDINGYDFSMTGVDIAAGLNYTNPMDKDKGLIISLNIFDWAGNTNTISILGETPPPEEPVYLDIKHMVWDKENGEFVEYVASRVCSDRADDTYYSGNLNTSKYWTLETSDRDVIWFNGYEADKVVEWSPYFVGLTEEDYPPGYKPYAIMDEDGNKVMTATPKLDSENDIKSYTTSSYSIQVTSDSDDQVFYAYYIPLEYTVTFDPGNGEILPDGEIVKTTDIAADGTVSKGVFYDMGYGLLPTAVQKGYKFDGWYIDTSSISNTTDAKNATTDQIKETTPYTFTENITLKAKYTVNSYDIIMDYGSNGGWKNDGTAKKSETITLKYTDTLSFQNYPATKEDDYGDTWTHTHDYWSLQEDSTEKVGNQKFEDGTKVSTSSYSIPVSSLVRWQDENDLDEIRIYATYSKDIDIYFYDYDGYVLAGDMDYEGYSSTKDFKSTKSDVHKNTFTIWNNEKTTSVEAPEICDMEPTVTDDNKWTALGWAEETQAANSNTPTITYTPGSTVTTGESINLYAQYEKKVTVSFDMNDSGNTYEPMIGTRYFNSYYVEMPAGGNPYDNPEFELPAGPTWSGYSFKQWFIDEDNDGFVNMSDKDGDGMLEPGENTETVYQAGDVVNFSFDVTLTADWDKYPEIEAYDRYFTLEDAQNGLITIDELLDKVTVTDREDDKHNIPISATIPYYQAEDFTSLEDDATVSVTYRTQDSFGNVVTKTIYVHVVKEGEEATRYYIRYISDDYFLNEDGSFVATDAGGTEEYSVWRRLPEYTEALTRTLSNEKTNIQYSEKTLFGKTYKMPIAGSGDWTFVEETWVLNKSDIDEVKNYLLNNDKFGYYDDSLDNWNDAGLDAFYSQFEDLRRYSAAKEAAAAATE